MRPALVRAGLLATLPVLAVAPARAAGGAPSAAVTAAPAASRFGDAFTLEAVVRVPDGQDAAVLLDPAPFTALSPASTERHGEGGTTVVTVRQRVACLDLGCAPGARPSVVTIRPVRVRVGGVTTAATASTTRVTISGRVPAAVVDRDAGGYRVDRSVPGATFPVAPGTLVALLLAGAVAAALAAAALLRPDVRRRLAGRTAAVEVDPLTRALRLLRESAGRGPGDRRRAASLLARLLRAHGEGARAGGAARLAWSRPDPAPADAVGLADAVEREGPG